MRAEIALLNFKGMLYYALQWIFFTRRNNVKITLDITLLSSDRDAEKVGFSFVNHYMRGGIIEGTVILRSLFVVAVVLFFLSSIALGQDYCEGDFDCNWAVDAEDVMPFSEDFGSGPV
jgi:hypothetical protein